MIIPNYSMNKREKNSFGLADRDMKTLQDIFKKYPDVKNVFVFGSWARVMKRCIHSALNRSHFCSILVLEQKHLSN